MISRIPVPRVRTAEEATELVGSKVPTHEPTFRGPALFLDADTGEPVMGHLPMTDLDRFRSVILGIEWGGSTDNYRAASGNRNKSWTFGYRPRKPMMRNEGCVLSSFGRDNPAAHAYLAHYADVLARQLGGVFPEIEIMGRDVIQQVLPDWRLSDDSLWTSGVINKESSLPYHRDGNNFDAWSVMPVVRRGVRGGHLHVPEYDMVVPCRDGYSVMFFGKKLVHGVTPMVKTTPDAYRISVVYYALRGLKDCHTFAEETARAAVKRTEREAALGRKAADPNDPGPERVLNRDSRPAEGGAARFGSGRNAGRGRAMTYEEPRPGDRDESQPRGGGEPKAVRPGRWRSM
ncbi:hypothetical protein ACFV9C_25310 [Kribbella sp. NPDC059898]|uniref:hypothetical protein n=1 Tax=Kribbella sp. NPDC059898 TaxID=3346995 RepID=UPI00365B1AD2